MREAADPPSEAHRTTHTHLALLCDVEVVDASTRQPRSRHPVAPVARHILCSKLAASVWQLCNSAAAWQPANSRLAMRCTNPPIPTTSTQAPPHPAPSPHIPPSHIVQQVVLKPVRPPPPVHPQIQQQIRCNVLAAAVGHPACWPGVVATEAWVSWLWSWLLRGWLGSMHTHQDLQYIRKSQEPSSTHPQTPKPQPPTNPAKPPHLKQPAPACLRPPGASPSCRPPSAPRAQGPWTTPGADRWCRAQRRWRCRA